MMPTFQYKARDTSGKSIGGSMEADSKIVLIEKLQKLGYVTTQAKETFPALELPSLFQRIRPVSPLHLTLFFVQLADFMRAGIPLLSSLRTLSGQLESRKLSDVVRLLCGSIEGGTGFSESLQAHPRIFTPLCVSLMKVGEATGKLDVILSRYAAYCEQEEEILQKIKGALFYPALLLAGGILVTLFVVTFLIPQFVVIFAQAGISLPLPTRVLYGAGLALKQFWLSFFLLAAALGIAFRAVITTPRGKLMMNRMTLRIPVWGVLERKTALGGFCRSLALLISAGVPLLQSLEIVKQGMDNEVLAQTLEKVKKSVAKGEKISDTLRVSGEFPADTVQMIAVGEETGNLDEMLAKAADFHDRALGYSLKKITVLIEPVLLLLMGALVAFIMASLLLPLFDMIKVLKR